MAKSKSELFFSLPKGWEETLRGIFANGGGDIEAHLAIGVDAVSHKKLLEVEQYMIEFENGMAVSEAWWMKWARESLVDQEGSTTYLPDGTKIETKPKKADTKLFEIMMKRMFAWDKRLDKPEKPENKNKDPQEAVEKFKNKYGIKVAK